MYLVFVLLKLMMVFVVLLYYGNVSISVNKELISFNITRKTIANMEMFVYGSGAPNSAKFRGVAEGHPRFDKGGWVAIFFTFYALKIKLFRDFTLSD